MISLRISGSQALIEALKREGVKVIFGIPGGAIIHVYDVLYGEKEIRHILMRHEQCITLDTEILVNDYELVEIGELKDKWFDVKILAPNPSTKSLDPYAVKSYTCMDPKLYMKKVYRLTTKETGRFIKATGDHPFWTQDGWKALEGLKMGDKVAVLPLAEVREEKSKDVSRDLPPGFVWETVADIREVGAETVVDIEVEDVHCFIANGFLVHNCAGHAADGFARVTGGSGVCMATSGPGATNLVTAIATAYMDSSPVVAITGQVPTSLIGRDAFQETDIIGITTPITKHNYQVRSVKDIPRIVKEAFYIASAGRPGPVLIDLPKDVQMTIDDIDFDVKINVRGYKPNLDPHPLQVKKAVDLLVKAERPIIFAGGGIHWSKAYTELLTLAELLMAPITTSFMGKGVIPENHPLCLGCIGMHGRVEANKAIMMADVVLAVGVRFSDRSIGKVDEFCSDARIIHIDIDPSEIRKNVSVHLPIVADAKRALKAIIDELVRRGLKRESSEWLRRIEALKRQYAETEASKELTGANAVKTLRKVLPENAIVATEVGQNQMWASLHFKVLKPRTFVTSGGLGTMGFGFPASLGAKAARPDVPVVDIAGDGSFLMTEQDLATSVAEDLPVTVIVLNNSSLGMVAQWQRLFFGRRYSQIDLKGIPDFAKLAEAFGARGVRVRSLNELEQVLREAIKSDVTVVVDVPISREENVLPFVPPGKSLREVII